MGKSADAKILVVTQSYPTEDGNVQSMYVRTRNMWYVFNGLNITVINFNADRNYFIDGVKVITKETYKSNPEKYEILIIHAANIRSHYLFLKKYGDNFKQFIFFYHGHEVMKLNQDYCAPYSYMRTNIINRTGQDIYDNFKLGIWREYLPRIIDKAYFVFVSKWMYDTFMKNVKFPLDLMKNKYSIIYNSVGKSFEVSEYNSSLPKKYDFITIRSNLDDSKYAIDIVNRLAENSPLCKFLIIGKGRFFEYNTIAKNIEWKNKTMSHDEIIKILQNARYALMPTRTDAQGLMMCEMAAFGIPVITSDIPICHEVFDGFDNVSFINNQDRNLSLDDYRGKKNRCVKDTRYYSINTIEQELKIIYSFL